MSRTLGRTVILSDMSVNVGVYRYDWEIPYASVIYELDWPSEWQR